MSGLTIHSTTPHDHTGRSLPCTPHKLRIKLENDTWPFPFLITKQRTKTATNLNPFSRRVSRAHMVTLTHTYILTRTPHMCTRTDYHSMYTHPCKHRPHIRKYTQNILLCVSALELHCALSTDHSDSGECTQHSVYNKS